MYGSRKLWWAAIGVVALASTFGAQSIAADTEGRQAPVFDVLANLPVGFAGPPFSPEKPVVRAAKAEPVAVTEPPSRPAVQAWPGMARFFTINQVLAKANRNKHGTSNVQLASINPRLTETDAPAGLGIAKQGQEPFGLFTFKAPEGQLTKKWQHIQPDISADAATLTRCATDNDRCSQGEIRFAEMLKHAGTLTGAAKIEFINRKVNETIHYTSDIAQWGVADLWSAPVTADRKGSFDTGLGDCEDYAIAKYVALKASGVSPDKLRVLLVRDRTVGMDHAIVATNQDGHWMLLDNRWDRLIQDTDTKQFVPLFAINDDGVKLIAAPYASLQGAQPERLGQRDADTMPSWGVSAKTEPQQSAPPVPFFML
jgi:predicted transglutaminase-like cysteine proteinase